MVAYVISLNVVFVSMQRQKLLLHRYKSYNGKSHKSTLPQMGGLPHSDFKQLHRCQLLSYRFSKHTLEKSKERRRFFLFNLWFNVLASSANPLIISNQSLTSLWPIHRVPGQSYVTPWHIPYIFLAYPWHIPGYSPLPFVQSFQMV